MRARPSLSIVTSKKSARLRLPVAVMQPVPSMQMSLYFIGCWLATDCTMCGLLLAAWSICANHVHHCWLAFADGPSLPSCLSVLSVPYQTTSMMPLRPAATHGISWTPDGGRLILIGLLQAPQSLPLGAAHE